MQALEEFDEIEVIDIPLEEFLQAIKIRAEANLENKYSLALKWKDRNWIQYHNYKIEGNVLRLWKTAPLATDWNSRLILARSQRIISNYHNVEGSIRIQLEPYKSKTRLKIKYKTKNLRRQGVVVSIIFSVLFTLINWSFTFPRLLLAVAIIFGGYVFGSMLLREEQNALSQYLKAYLLNVINS